MSSELTARPGRQDSPQIPGIRQAVWAPALHQIKFRFSSESADTEIPWVGEGWSEPSSWKRGHLGRSGRSQGPLPERLCGPAYGIWMGRL